MKEKGKCNCCGKERVIFYNGMCQTCYKESTKAEKENNQYVRNKKITSNIIQNEIIGLFLYANMSRKEIYKYINKKYKKCNYRYICRVIYQYTELERVDSDE